MFTITCLTLLFSGVVIFCLSQKTNNFWSAIYVFAVIVFGVFIRLAYRVGGWIEFVLKDAADGFTCDTGIYYREFFRWHFVPWHNIEHLECWSSENGRISAVLAFRQFPLQFGPASPDVRSHDVIQLFSKKVADLSIREDRRPFFTL